MPVPRTDATRAIHIGAVDDSITPYTTRIGTMAVAMA
uniref:Uncharacterized protein n=1 Tax=Decurrovirus sp. TaxID=2832697 RepID=A0AAU8HXI0_9CAUD